MNDSKRQLTNPTLTVANYSINLLPEANNLHPQGTDNSVYQEVEDPHDEVHLPPFGLGNVT